jgi:hypothetical protein
MNPLGAAITLILSLMVFVSSRTVAVIAIILGVCYITQGQEITLLFHFTAIRTILLAGLVRVIARGELRSRSPGRVDKTIIIYALCISGVCFLRVHDSGNFVYQLGNIYNALVAYFVFRGLVRDAEDIESILRSLAYLLAPLALLMIVEARSGSSAFISLGGLDGSESVVRDNHVRCQGPFRQAITAGSFGATFALFYAGLIFFRFPKPCKLWIGFVFSMIIMITAHSSGPILGFVIGLFSFCLWKYRLKMRTLRWAIVGSLAGLTVFMKDPPWFIVARLGDLVGGGGYHRAYLIDRFIHSFSEWWLEGSDDTSNWFPYHLYSGRADITNQFVSDGLNGGTLGLLVSVVLVVVCYKQLGNSLRAIYGLNLVDEQLLWCLASIYTATIGILFSVTYFDQMQVIWYFLMASISVAVGSRIAGGDLSHGLSAEKTQHA